MRPTLTVEFALGGNGPGAASYFQLDSTDKGVLDQNWLAPTSTPGTPSPVWFTLDDVARGKLDVGMLAGDALGQGFWVDVSTQVTQCSVRRGRRRLTETFSTGTATLTLDNNDRRFDPYNLVGPYAANGATNLRSRVPCRISATYAGVRYPIFYGFVDEWNPDYQEPGTGTCTVTVSDAFKVLAEFDPVALGSPVGAGELSGARINRILDNAGWPTVDRRIDTGDSPMQGTVLSQNALTELKLVADSERGDLLVDADGTILFRERHARFERAASNTAQAIFGDATGELEFADCLQPVNDELIKNVANVARVGGVSQTDGSDLSRVQFFPKTFTRTDLLITTDAEALEYARWIIRQFADQDKRVEQITLDPDGIDTSTDPGADLWPQVCGRQIGDRITVKRRPLGGSLFTAECWIEGIQHDIAPLQSGGWITKFDLSDASRSNAFVLDHSALGQLDRNVLAY